MKPVLVILIIALFAFKAKAQTITVGNEEPVYSTDIDTPPEFIDGMDRFYERVSRIPYTFLDRLSECEGKVTVIMIIEQDGSVSNLNVLHGFSEKQDQEILRMMRRLKKWKPGTLHGKPVRVLCSIPIDFKLLKS